MNEIPLFLNHNKKNTFYIPVEIKSKNKKTYEIQDRIANGGNAVVYQCTEKSTGQEFAIKFQLTPYNQQRLNRFYQEVELLKQVEHEQLIQYKDEGEINFKRKSSEKNYNTRNKIPYVVMNLANENLARLSQNRNIPYEEYIGQFKGLASALASIHEKAIHRDIKPQNILIEGETWLLSDFGLCKITNGEEENELTHKHENIGPRYWMSPESIHRSLGIDDEIKKYSDVFQLSSVFWFVVNKRYPLGVISKDDWNGPEELFEVIYNALSNNCEKRPSDGRELLEQLEEATLKI